MKLKSDKQDITKIREVDLVEFCFHLISIPLYFL